MSSIGIAVTHTQTPKEVLRETKTSNLLDTPSRSQADDIRKDVAKMAAQENAKKDRNSKEIHHKVAKDINSSEANISTKCDNPQRNSYKTLDGQILALKPISANTLNNIYINGILTSPESAFSTAQTLFKDQPGNQYILYNATSDNFFIDAEHAIAGKCSYKLGRDAEKSVDTLVDFIREKIKNDEVISLHAHSQGSVITQNALAILKDKLSSNDWEKLTQNLTVTLYGTVTYDFPDSIKVTSYELLDPITLLAKIGPDPDKNENIEKISCNEIGHSMDLYIQNIHGNPTNPITFSKIKNTLHKTCEKIADTSSRVYNHLKEDCEDILSGTKSFFDKVKNKISKCFT